MSEEADNPEAPKPEELQSLFGSFDLTPDWAKGDPGVTQAPSEGRGRGGRRENRRDNRRDNRGDNRGEGGRPRVPKSSRPNMQGVRVKPRRDSAGDGGGSQEYHGPRDGNREGRRDRPRREERAPRVPVHVDFIPEKKRLSKVVKVIRQSCRAYPLKVVAGKFMENPRFISMKYTVKENAPAAEDFHLYVCTANGMTFTDRQACEQYILDHAIQVTYECEEREVPAPAGNFVCVGRHTRSGRLVGPPNWHGYQARLEALRAEMAEGLPPDVFSRQIEMVHDADVIEAWKKEVSIQSFYRKKLEPVSEPEKPAETAPAPEPTEAEAAAEASPEEAVAEQPAAEASEQVEVTAEASTDEQAAPPEETASEEIPAESAPAEEAAAEPEPVVDDRPFELTREQAEADFRENQLPKMIRKTKRAIMPGYLMSKMTDPSLLSLTQFHLNREHDRPNSIVFALRPAFKHMRLHVFRFQGELMVSGIPQHPLPDDMKVVPEIRSILDYVAAHPGCTNHEALSSVANTSEEVPAELVSHFRWLIEKGHLVEMHDETLQLPHTLGKR